MIKTLRADFWRYVKTEDTQDIQSKETKPKKPQNCQKDLLFFNATSCNYIQNIINKYYTINPWSCKFRLFPEIGKVCLCYAEPEFHNCWCSEMCSFIKSREWDKTGCICAFSNERRLGTYSGWIQKTDQWCKLLSHVLQIYQREILLILWCSFLKKKILSI